MKKRQKKNQNHAMMGVLLRSKYALANIYIRRLVRCMDPAAFAHWIASNTEK